MNGLSETEPSLSLANSGSILKKSEPHVLFSVNKQNHQVTIVVNPRELHQQEMLWFFNNKQTRLNLSHKHGYMKVLRYFRKKILMKIFEHFNHGESMLLQKLQDSPLPFGLVWVKFSHEHWACIVVNFYNECYDFIVGYQIEPKLVMMLRIVLSHF